MALHSTEGSASSVGFVYALLDPETEEVRYVGFTRFTLEKRLQEHLCDGFKTHRRNWIQSLRRRGLRPTITLLETVVEEPWQAREQWWIKHCREAGCNLVNGTDGGDGMNNPSEEVRRKCGDAQRGKKRVHSPETVERIRQQALARYAGGWKPSDESVDSMKRKLRGRTHTTSDETKEKIRQRALERYRKGT